MIRTTIIDPATKKSIENSAVSAETFGTSKIIPATTITIAARRARFFKRHNPYATANPNPPANRNIYGP